ncbi:hypothetical protein PMZ80_010501 [Knufia obscura]|uniref:Uncharacterized protein n=1 Tax=Knufia obscura TaxID=1635080 RepID=A0ABR0R9A0_9EURO|nr:hypothetical protein PMZ80_010501 [Knufia obscura]
MSTSAPIPGFYYDAQKGKYFRIQADHRAPAGAAHSRSAINASQQATKLTTALTTRRRREQLGTIKRINPSSFSNLYLQFRLGTSSSASLLARYYASNLQSRFAAAPAHSSLESVTVRSGVGEIFCAMTNDNLAQTRVYQLNPLSYEVFDNDENIQRIREPSQTFDAHRSGLRQSPVGLVPAGRQHMAAFNGQHLTCHAGNPDRVNTTNEYFGTTYQHFGFADTIWDIAGTPIVKDFYDVVTKSSVAIAASNGLWIADPTVYVNPSAPRDKGRPQDEQMAVAYQDVNIVMSGQRSGRVNFIDVRAPGSVYRIHHSSAINGITTARTNNHIIVSGFSTTDMYDLRYTKAIDQTQSQRPRKRAGKKRSQVMSVISSKPFVSFNVSDSRTSTHYGCGKPLAYLSSHDIAVVATRRRTAEGRPPQNRVTLYQASTGRVLSGPLTNSQPFNEIHDVAVARVRDGPESIFVATPQRLYEWNVDVPNQDYGYISHECFPPDSEPKRVRQWLVGDEGPLAER